jgi:hypothetical protein
MGECQDSGKTPYKSPIDLKGPAFKCTCLSRKFACKHGLDLHLLSAADPELFAPGAEPRWVGDWLSSRQARQEKKADNAAPISQDLAAAAAAAIQARKREEKREDKVDAGMRELQTWLHDLAREGLAAVRSRGQGMWDGIAARMADAQAAPLGRRLRRAGSLLCQSGLRELLAAGPADRHLHGTAAAAAPHGIDVHRAGTPRAGRTGVPWRRRDAGHGGRQAGHRSAAGAARAADPAYPARNPAGGRSHP